MSILIKIMKKPKLMILIKLNQDRIIKHKLKSLILLMKIQNLNNLML